MTTLRDFANYVTDKINLSRLTPSDYISTEHLLPNKGGRIPCTELPVQPRVTQFKTNDILVSNIRPYFKKIWFSNRIGGCSNDVLVFRPKSDKCDAKFLYYVLAQDSFFDFMMSGANGTKMPRGNKKLILNFQVPERPLKTQRRIANILSAYDDLIENNRKQIKLLEEAAQRLYKEWFIDLRFPGHEHTKIVNGVPEGWAKERLIDIADVQYGYAFDSSLFNSKRLGMPIIRIRNIPKNQTEDYTTEAADSQYMVYNGEIVIGMDGEFHVNSWAGDTAYLVQRTCRIKPHNADLKGFLLWAIYEPIKYFERAVVGATVAHLGKKHIDTIQILVPTERLYSTFSAIFNKRLLLMNQSKKLAEARDRLLPKLIREEVEE